MKAIILAAGEGCRMRPLTFSRPKPMIPIGNKPILEHLMEACSQAGIKEFIFVVGYKDHVIRDYFGDGRKWNVNICYRQQLSPKGTADAVRLAQNMVGDKFIVLNGDMILRKEDIHDLINSKQITITCKELDNTTGLGVLDVQNGEVQHIYEKPDYALSKLANTGAYFLTEEIFSAIACTSESPRGQYELTHSLELLIEKGTKIACQPIDFWLNLSFPWDLLDANAALLENLDSRSEGVVEDGVHIHGPCLIGKNTTVRSGAYIVGPVLIGQNCDIGPNCYIRPSTSIGDYCHIGASVEIKNSIIMPKTKIPHQSYVGDSVVGENCNLGAGTKIANLRFDHRNIKVDGIDTGRRKLGAIIGDNVQSGINVVINAGTVIGDDVFIWPGVFVDRDIKSGSRITVNHNTRDGCQ